MSSRWLGTLIGFFLLAACLHSFSPLLASDCEFHNLDDDQYVYANPHVNQGVTLSGLWWDLTAYHSNNWHPLTWLSLQIDADVYGMAPWGFHLTSILLHALASIILFQILRRMTGAIWPSALTAALFALHPMHVESVAWIAERKDVLCALFFFLMLGAYARYVTKPSWKSYLLVAVCFTLALVSKAMAVTAPFVLLLLDYWPLRRLVLVGNEPIANQVEPFQRPSWRFVLLEKLPLLSISLLSIFLTLQAQHHIVQSVDVFSLPNRLANSVISYWRYIVMMVWPLNLCAFYPHPGDNWSVTELGVSLGSLLAISLAILIPLHRQRYLTVGWFWYLGMLIPVIGVVQVGMQGMADRYSYIPSIGLFVMVSWGLSAVVRVVPRSGPWLAIGASVAVLSCMILTSQQADYWHDDVALERRISAVTESKGTSSGFEQALGRRGGFSEAISYFRNNPTANAQFYQSLKVLGEAYVRASKPQEALEGYKKILALAQARNDGDLELLRLQYGQICLKVPGQHQEALTQFNKVLERQPASYQATIGIAKAYIIADQPEKAIAKLSAFNKANTESIDAKQTAEEQTILGQAYLLLDKPADALPYLQRAQTLDPHSASVQFYMAFALESLERTQEAQEQYLAAKQVDPKWPAQVVYEALVMASNPSAQARNGRLALLNTRIALSATNGDDPLVFIVLGASYAELGRFDEAVKIAQQALNLAELKHESDLAKLAQEQLRLFQNKQPFRSRR